MDLDNAQEVIWNITQLEGVSNSTKAQLIKTYIDTENVPHDVFLHIKNEGDNPSNVMHNPDISLLMPLFMQDFSLFKEIVSLFDIDLNKFKRYEDETSYFLTYLLLNEESFEDHYKEKEVYTTRKKEIINFLLEKNVSLDSYLYINNKTIFPEYSYDLLISTIITQDTLGLAEHDKLYLPDFIKCYRPKIFVEEIKKEDKLHFFYSYLVDKVLDLPFDNDIFKGRFLNHFWEKCDLELNLIMENNKLFFNDAKNIFSRKGKRINNILEIEQEIIKNPGVFIENKTLLRNLLINNKIDVIGSINHLLDNSQKNKYYSNGNELVFNDIAKSKNKKSVINFLEQNIVNGLRLTMKDDEIVNLLKDIVQEEYKDEIKVVISRLEKNIIGLSLSDNGEEFNINKKSRL